MITSIQRDWIGAPSIIRIVTNDNYATVSATGYLTAQAAQIILINAGAFEWDPSDFVLVTFENDSVVPPTFTWAQFSISADFTSLIPFIGANSVVTPVVSGDLAMFDGTTGLLQDSGVSAASVTQTVIVTLNTAAVTGMYAAPALILASPGVGKAVIPINAQIITEVSTAFTGGGNAQLQWGNTVHAGGTLALDATTPTAEITAASSQIYTQKGLATTTVTATATITNQGLYFTNATGAFTAGTGSTVTLAVIYMTIPCV
jgi:hypothetical protein